MTPKTESTITSLPSSTTMPLRPARETPAPEPLHAGLTDPAHCVNLEDEKTVILRLDQIQGNILGGFSKDFQTMIFLEITDAAEFQEWLATQVKFVATSAE